MSPVKHNPLLYRTPAGHVVFKECGESVTYSGGGAFILPCGLRDGEVMRSSVGDGGKQQWWENVDLYENKGCIWHTGSLKS